MIKIKHGVNVQGLKPEILLAILIADPMFEAHGVDCVITSLLEGAHKPGSFHYDGLAVDLRSRELTEGGKISVVTALRNALGDQYDVVLESTHIHIEFDPR